MKLKFTVISRLETINEQGKNGFSVTMVAEDALLSAKLQFGTTDSKVAENFSPGRELEITMPTFQKPVLVPESN